MATCLYITKINGGPPKIVPLVCQVRRNCDRDRKFGSMVCVINFYICRIKTEIVEADGQDWIGFKANKADTEAKQSRKREIVIFRAGRLRNQTNK